uniref:Uncharacterized protein n=1 Tax=Oryza glumipatula TaxID=40148 RepID=A0A0E0AFT1_9ORYZ
MEWGRGHGEHLVAAERGKAQWQRSAVAALERETTATLGSSGSGNGTVDSSEEANPCRQVTWACELVHRTGGLINGGWRADPGGSKAFDPTTATTIEAQKQPPRASPRTADAIKHLLWNLLFLIVSSILRLSQHNKIGRCTLSNGRTKEAASSMNVDEGIRVLHEELAKIEATSKEIAEIIRYNRFHRRKAVREVFRELEPELKQEILRKYSSPKVSSCPRKKIYSFFRLRSSAAGGRGEAAAAAGCARVEEGKSGSSQKASTSYVSYHTPRVFSPPPSPARRRLAQNLRRSSLFSSIFSTSSMGRPLVSGTQTSTNASAATDSPPKMRNVHAAPMASVSDRNDCATARFDTQFAVAAAPPHTPRCRSG